MKLTITIEQLNKLQEKFNILNKYGVKVNTKNGYKPIKAIGITSPNSDKIIIKTEDFELIGSPMHRVKFRENWIHLKDINIGDLVDTVNGEQSIISVKKDDVLEDLWDIEVEGGEYYTNGILSHNSSLIESVEYCLYGKVRGRSKKWSTLSTLPNRINGELQNRIKFYSSGSEIEVIRGISPNILKLLENGISDEKAGKSNLDDKIEKYIGLDVETFKSFISMSVNDFKNFISLTNEEKQLLLDKLFNLEVINVLNNILKDLNKVNKNQIIKYDAEISSLNESILSIKQSIEKALEKEKINLEGEIQNIKLEMESKRELWTSLKEKGEKAKLKESELKDEMQGERDQLNSTEKDIKIVLNEINLYNSGKCPTCGTDFNTEHFINLGSLLKEKLEKLELVKGAIIENISLIKSRQIKLQKIIDDITTSFNDINYLLKNSKLQIEKLNRQKESEISINLEEFKTSISDLELKREESKNNSLFSKDRELYYKELNKIFGEDGVKKTIISGIIKPINYFISENLTKMGLPFQVVLDETFTADIKQFGMNVEHNSLSTGENKLTNIAILIAYLKLIRTKKHINILFLDEVFSSIDVSNIERILILLKDFADEYNINIFVVHHAIMRQELFDRIILINKDIFSTIEEIDLYRMV